MHVYIGDGVGVGDVDLCIFTLRVNCVAGVFGEEKNAAGLLIAGRGVTQKFDVGFAGVGSDLCQGVGIKNKSDKQGGKD